MAAPPIIVPPDPLLPNQVDTYRYDGCFQTMALVLLQRIVESTDDTALIAKVQEIIDALTTLNGKVATETTLALIEAITAQMNFTGGALDVNATISTAGLATEAKQDNQITLATAANALLTLLEGKDFATETTLEAVKGVLDAIKLDTANLDVALSTRATEVKQSQQIDIATIANLLLNSINDKVATETTLAAIKAQTDLLNFTGAKLRTTGEDASGGGGTSTFGDTSTVSTVPVTDASTSVLSANTDRKEAIFYNDSTSTIWLFFGTPAVFGTGIPLIKQQQFISDKYRGQVTAIMDTGKTGNLQVTDVLL